MIRSPAGALSRWSFIPALPLLIVAMVAAPDARGQVAPPPGGPVGTPAPPAPPAPAAPAAMPAIGSIPVAVKSLKTNAEFTPDHRAGIQSFVAGAVANLAGTNAGLQTKARNALINEALVNGLPQASATYLDIYAQALNQQLQPLASHESPRVRLNAAIVAAEVARVANNIHLAPTAQAFLNDKSDGIVLWAMKAARWIIPAQLRFPGQFNKQLADMIVPTVAKHSQGQVAGAIALEAYLAVTIDIFNPAAPPAPEHLKIMAPYVLELLNERLKLYVKGVPPSARGESFGTGFITSPRVVQVLTPQQQAAAMQTIINLIVLAGQQAQPANQGDRFELVLTIQRAASGVSTVAPATAKALAPATQLNPKDATPQQVKAAIEPIVDAVRLVPQFKALKDPPPIQGNEPAPPPASAPTTGNVLIPGATTQPTGPAAPGVPLPPGTTPTAPVAPGAGPEAKPVPKAPGAKPDGATEPKQPQSPRPTNPPTPGATPAPGAGGAGAAGGPTPQPPAR
jgi:hypothetical protein